VANKLQKKLSLQFIQSMHVCTSTLWWINYTTQQQMQRQIILYKQMTGMVSIPILMDIFNTASTYTWMKQWLLGWPFRPAHTTHVYSHTASSIYKHRYNTISYFTVWSGAFSLTTSTWCMIK